MLVIPAVGRRRYKWAQKFKKLPRDFKASLECLKEVGEEKETRSLDILQGASKVTLLSAAEVDWIYNLPRWKLPPTLEATLPKSLLPSAAVGILGVNALIAYCII